MFARSQTKKNIILLLGIVFTGLGMIMLSPAGKLDSKFLYDAAYARHFFQSLTALQTKHYFWCEILDLLFMLLYSLLLVSLFRQNFKSKIAYFAVLPGVLDLIETLSIIIVLNQGSVDLHILSVVSSLKWICGGCLLLTLGVKWSRNRFAA